MSTIEPGQRSIQGITRGGRPQQEPQLLVVLVIDRLRECVCEANLRAVAEAACQFGLQRIVVVVTQGNQLANVRPALALRARIRRGRTNIATGVAELGIQNSPILPESGRLAFDGQCRVYISVRERAYSSRSDIANITDKSGEFLLDSQIERLDVASAEITRYRRGPDSVGQGIHARSCAARQCDLRNTNRQAGVRTHCIQSCQAGCRRERISGQPCEVGDGYRRISISQEPPVVRVGADSIARTDDILSGRAVGDAQTGQE